MDSINVSLLELNDLHKLANVLSIAMLNNPVHVAVLQGNCETQRLQIEHMFLELFQSLPGITFVAKQGDRIVGGMRMKSCYGSTTKKSQKDIPKENNIDHRIRIWHEEWAANDPPKQHWHLGPIGVLPTHQNKGIGSMLMKIFCREVDKCSATAFLETDLDKNVLFYEKFRFKVVSTSNIFGVESRYMAREAVN